MLNLADTNSTDTTSTDYQNGRRERLLPPEAEPPQQHHHTPQQWMQLSCPAEFPNVFDESKDMLLSAILMYGLVDLRQLARDDPHQQKTHQQPPDNDDDRMQPLLELPISAKEVVRLVARHRPEIEASSRIGKDATQLYLNVLDGIQATSSSRELEVDFRSAMTTNHNNNNNTDNDTAKTSPVLVDFSIVAVQDDHVDQELVYAICVDTARRRITVLFRGCSTRMDWSICANNILHEAVNPLMQQSMDDTTGTKDSRDRQNHDPQDYLYQQQQQQQQQQPSTIAIHSGYCNYLFNSSRQANGVCKFDEIVAKLQELLIEYPGYQVYVTGHSLGAALATVFSFQAAATQCLETLSNPASKKTPPQQQQHPITCINFASPMVGNLDFETAFRSLEARGLLRCLRVTNHFDIFTQLPDRGNWLYVIFCCWGLHLVAYVGWSLLFFLCFQKNVYRHVGMDLHMYKHNTGYFGSSFCCNGGCWKKSNNNHQKFNPQPPNSTKKKPKTAYSYKVKHSRGTSHNFAWRVAQDWKKHLKQAVQRVLMIPFVVDFNTNHSAQEHLLRLSALSGELEGFYLKDLYDNQRVPASSLSPTSNKLPPMTISPMEAITSGGCFV